MIFRQAQHNNLEQHCQEKDCNEKRGCASQETLTFSS